MNERIRLIETDTSVVATGHLLLLGLFNPRPKETIGLPGDISVLTFPISARHAHLFEKKYEDARFGFGHVELEDGPVLTMRFQLGDFQIYWVADITDPELWAAIDSWKRARRVPIMFAVDQAGRRNGYVAVVGIPGQTLPEEVHRDSDRRPTVDTWHAMASLAGSGLLQMQATSDIPGMALQHVLAGAVLTRRLEPFVHQRPLVKKPVVVKASWVPA